MASFWRDYHLLVRQKQSRVNKVEDILVPPCLSGCRDQSHLPRMKVKKICLLIAFCMCPSKANGLPDSVVIETKYGKVEGDVVNVPKEDFVVAAFKGIPYGTAKRFQKPEPVEPWKDTLDARNWGKRCIQHQVFGNIEPPMADDVSEDCLHLNVFAPFEKGDQQYPVMVFIHGGGFADGSSNDYGQEGIINWMVPKGVIVITINYRLGPWGFFSSGTKDAPGNYGLWDQTMALRWVRENINRFGGDPNKVTIFGESGGGISVSLLALSPHSRDLFQQSIVMSGSSHVPWFSPDTANTLEAAKILSSALGCGHIQATSRLECLKGKSSVEIINALHTYRPFGKFEYIGFVPVNDGDFFPESLEKLHETASPKPTISGTTTDEMGLFTVTVFPFDLEWILKDPESFTVDQLIEKLPFFFPVAIYGKWTPVVHQLALHHYLDSLGDRRNNSFVVHQYKQLFSDFMFGYPAFKEALLRHERGSKVWLYSFDYYDNALFPKDFKYKGAQHFLELPYLFKMMPAFHPSPFDGDDKKMQQIMTTLWTNFAKYGHPNPEHSPFHKAFSWDPISHEKSSRYLSIGPQPQQRDLYNRPMVSFWNELLPKLQDIAENWKGSDGKSIKIEL